MLETFEGITIEGVILAFVITVAVSFIFIDTIFGFPKDNDD